MNLPDWLPLRLILTGDLSVDDPILFRVYSQMKSAPILLVDSLKFDLEPESYMHDVHTSEFETIAPRSSLYKHLVSDHVSGSSVRSYASGRACHLPWIRAIVSNYRRPEVIRWCYRLSGKAFRMNLWLRDYDYVVVLEPRPRNRRIYLITAFDVFEARRPDLENRLKRDKVDCPK